MTALGAGNKYPEAQGLGLGRSRFFYNNSKVKTMESFSRTAVAEQFSLLVTRHRARVRFLQLLPAGLVL